MVRGRFQQTRGFLSLIQKEHPDGAGYYYECPKCHEEFNTFKQLNHHRKEVHSY